MSPPRTRLDPEGYYHRLGLDPDADHEAVVAAFRARVRVLHPDVPGTGNAAAFVAVKQAYDVLSNPHRRHDYDQAAQRAAQRAAVGTPGPDMFSIRPARPVHAARPAPTTAPTAAPTMGPWPAGAIAWLADAVNWVRTSTPLAAIGLGFAAILCISVVQVVLHVEQTPPVVSDGIRPNAATVQPLSPEAHDATLYGPAPARLPGPPNFYVIPTASPAILWRYDPARNRFVPDRQLPPFSSVHAVRFVRQNGLLEVLVRGQPDGYVEAAQVAPGNYQAARRGYCSYNAGSPPFNGEVLVATGQGNGRLLIDNRAVQPVVVKLRDPSWRVVFSVYLAPGGHADVTGLPYGAYRTDFAIGELWSRACQTFAAGMRARRLDGPLTIAGQASLQITDDSASLPSTDIADSEFEQN
ncbi:J domain-containing protein [Rhodopila globiformis]|uniref:J domain-containing protein n=1 Tax=Rhodopila globiformis TaxID=1071 RepID=A0A2S6NDP1_RHOGL|nr:J domain-containing protein [Rhodopila globiformis]PPQ32738.1 hypothetical protein CCS01_15460 [Rhodopila globiformis]